MENFHEDCNHLITITKRVLQLHVYISQFSLVQTKELLTVCLSVLMQTFLQFI